MASDFPTQYSEQEILNRIFDKLAQALGVTAVTRTAGEDLNLDRTAVAHKSNYTNLTASALIKTGVGLVSGFIVNSHTSGTLKLWDNTSAATTTLMDTYAFSAGSSVVDFGSDIVFNTGLYATIGGTANITLIWL